VIPVSDSVSTSSSSHNRSFVWVDKYVIYFDDEDKSYIKARNTANPAL
jgi:hypothetical protein